MRVTCNDEAIKVRLDTLAEEYKQLLFQALLYESTSPDDLNIAELIRIDNEIKKPLVGSSIQTRKKERFQVMAALYGMLGIIFGVFSLIFPRILKNGFENIYDIYLLISIAMILSSFLLLIWSFIISTSRKNIFLISSRTSGYDKERKLLNYKVVSTWKLLESAVKERTGNKATAASSIIEVLQNTSILTESEQNRIILFLRLRNDIMHSERGSFYSNAEVKEMLEDITSIITSRIEQPISR